MTDSSPAELTDLTGLDRAARNLAATVRSTVDDRLHHPSYGVLKRDALDALARLEGALIARAAVTGASSGSAYYLTDVREQADALDIPLDALRRAVAGC